MEYLKDRTYEVFRYTLPGIFFIGVLALTDSSIWGTDDIFRKLPKEDWLLSSLLIIFAGFVVGIVIDQLAGFATQRIWKNRYQADYASESKLSESQKYALIREKSPANYRQIENSNAQKGMCENLAFGCTALFFVSLYKIFVVQGMFWVFMVMFSVIATLTLIMKARKFKTWTAQDIDATVDMIQQAEKN
ncbi:MAG: hypothetical protein AAFR61_11600 [Bacteroidota bacterium]